MRFKLELCWYRAYTFHTVHALINTDTTNIINSHELFICLYIVIKKITEITYEITHRGPGCKLDRFTSVYNCPKIIVQKAGYYIPRFFFSKVHPYLIAIGPMPNLTIITNTTRTCYYEQKFNDTR